MASHVNPKGWLVTGNEQGARQELSRVPMARRDERVRIGMYLAHADYSRDRGPRFAPLQ